MMANIAFGVVVGVIFSPLTIIFYNILPDSWLCDYGEVPDRKFHKNRNVEGVPLLCILALGYAMCAAVAVSRFGIVYALILSVFEMLLVMIVISDIKLLIVPDQLVLGILILGVIILLFDLLGGHYIFHKNIWSAVLGLLVGFSFFFFAGLIGNLITKQNTMGFGDIKLLAAIGLLVGLKGITIVIALTLLIALICFSVLIAVKKLSRDAQVAFAPYICGATAVYLLLGAPINVFIQNYFALF